jgi:ubiquinone/menaquinone biosynthesis C-methylase UbiE
VEQFEAITLIGPAIAHTGGTWADLGAGSGVFTRALAALLGPSGTVYAIDVDERALADLVRSAAGDQMIATIRTIVADFTEPIELPQLDGVVFANSLHYVPYADQARVLREVAGRLVDGAPIIVVEYDRRGSNRWVPYPIPYGSLEELAGEAGLGPPVRVGLQRSQFGGDLYAASLGRE